MVPFTLRQLEYFTAVFDAGSLREAAKVLHVSESALASGITQLENQLGVVLTVRRKSQGVALTPAGRAFAHEARSLLQKATLMHEQATGVSESITGSIVIGCTEAAAPTLLPPILMHMHELHPGIEVGFEIADRDQLLPRLVNGSLDIVLTTLFGLPAGFQWQPLHTRPVLVMLNAEHPLTELETIPPAALVGEPMILLELSPSVGRIMEAFRELGVAPAVRYRSDNTELVRALVGRGLGFALQIQRPYNDVTYEGLPLVYRPLAGGYSETAIITWPENSRLSPQAQLLVDTALSIAQNDSEPSHRSGGFT